MRHIETFSDIRLENQCAYCGKLPDTRDHVPSKILLGKPYPENLPVVPSCLKCNNGFSLDEEYFACLIECLISGTTNLKGLSNKSIVKTLKRQTKLKIRLDNAFVNENGESYFKIEPERIENVILKLAFGHVKYENSDRQYEKPKHLGFVPIHTLTEEEQNSFLSVTELQQSLEIGSRAMQNMYITPNGIPIDNWTVVQEGIYQYCVTSTTENIKVRILIGNYLACEVLW
ncbi:hypothetical protein BW723_14145 [Polaribacter reichenbachii]|uniref:HNH endonuclease 5 domain-containing protein n=1 Tax=Polaribacter reichenbachii TaxID=996801 RepID=A0A1B8U1E0_9FLAO|nr:hypothetical protein [Polaribacter reichenbachii]APZ47352.1 hypothetical protein BW723_14145 [Polaribacter reichenbachii]AUC17993.1 hypothetical protein BTO17_04600 [Polaribacter reichenbachii]OBY65680.1 hypothetical protein LPB301_07635 [Polaribacter reichenbachii]